MLLEVLRLFLAAADRPTLWRLTATFATVVASGALAAAAPLALKELVDAIAAPSIPSVRPDTESLLKFGGTYLLALCGVRLLMEIRPLLAGKAEQRLCARLSVRFFAHLLSLPLAFHLKARSGALVQTIHQATTGFQLLLISLVNSIVPVLIEVTTVVVVLAHLGQPALVLSFVVTALAYLCVFGLGAQRLKRCAGEVSTANLDIHAVLGDSLLNCEALKCFGAEPSACGRLARAAGELELRWSSLHLQRARIGIGATAVFSLSIALSLLLA